MSQITHVEVVPQDPKGWSVVRVMDTGYTYSVSNHRLKGRAIEAGKTEARKSGVDLRVMNRNGTRNWYIWPEYELLW